jgi:hypothetical protein
MLTLFSEFLILSSFREISDSDPTNRGKNGLKYQYTGSCTSKRLAGFLRAKHMGKITVRKKTEQAALPRLGLCQHRSPSLIDLDRLNERGKRCGELRRKTRRKPHVPHYSHIKSWTCCKKYRNVIFKSK